MYDSRAKDGLELGWSGVTMVVDCSLTPFNNNGVG